jgi:hypothetical protein
MINGTAASHPFLKVSSKESYTRTSLRDTESDEEKGNKRLKCLLFVLINPSFCIFPSSLDKAVRSTFR